MKHQIEHDSFILKSLLRYKSFLKNPSIIPLEKNNNTQSFLRSLFLLEAISPVHCGLVALYCQYTFKTDCYKNHIKAERVTSLCERDCIGVLAR